MQLQSRGVNGIGVGMPYVYPNGKCVFLNKYQESLLTTTLLPLHVFKQ